MKNPNNTLNYIIVNYIIGTTILIASSFFVYEEVKKPYFLKFLDDLKPKEKVEIVFPPPQPTTMSISIDELQEPKSTDEPKTYNPRAFPSKLEEVTRYECDIN